MNHKEPIDEKLEDLGKSIGSEKSLIDDVMKHIETEPTFKISQSKTQNIWRNIMKSRVSKLTAAAILILGVIIGSNFFQISSPVYAMTDLPELFGQAKVIHIKGRLHYNLTDKGEKVPPQTVERWIDLENERFRFSRISVYAGPEEVKFSITETISDGEYKVILNHAEKTAEFYKMSDLRRKLETNDSLNHLFYGHLFPDADILNEFSRTGEEEIDGVIYDIWEYEVQESPMRSDRYKYWLSRSGTSGRFQSWYKNLHSPWMLGDDLDLIECNVEIPEDVFELEVPEGYTAINTKENADFQELNIEAGTNLSGLKLDPRVSFTLSDGSVILAWLSEDTESVTSQGELFENLEFGGSLPNLPIQIYGLKPAGWIWKGNMNYQGRHLTYTQKNDKFIEWSLYVPGNPAPDSRQILGYDVLYKYNIENKPKSTMGIMVDYGMFIETSDDFNKYVLGAMAELSDDNKVPDDITYEKVFGLANQIIKSIP